MAKMTKKQLASTGSAIMKAAKKIYHSPGNRKKWTDCVKAAGKAYSAAKNR